MAAKRRGSVHGKGVDTGLKDLIDAPEGNGIKNSTTTIVYKAAAASANVCRYTEIAKVRQGYGGASQARDRPISTVQRPAWGSGLTPGKPRKRSPIRIGTPSRSIKIAPSPLRPLAPLPPPPSRRTEAQSTIAPSVTSPSHQTTEAAETPAGTAPPAKRFLSFAPAPTSARGEQVEAATAAERRSGNRSTITHTEEDPVVAPEYGQALATAFKQTDKKAGDVPVSGELQSAKATFLGPSSPRSPLDVCDIHTDFGTAVATTPRFCVAAQQRKPKLSADVIARAPLEAELAQSLAVRSALQAALEKGQRALDVERRERVAKEEEFALALHGSMKTAKAAEAQAQEAWRSLAARTAQLQAALAAESGGRVDAEARARAAHEALESARGENGIIAGKVAEGKALAQTEALRRQQLQAQMDANARECAVLRAALREEQAARLAAEEDAEGERTRGREDADAALRARAETVARLEEQLARARSGATAAVHEREELTAKLDAEAAKAEQLASQLEEARAATRQTLRDAAAAEEERASLRALVASAEARLAAAEKMAAASGQQVAQARALADSENARAKAVEEQLKEMEACRLEAVELATKDAERRTQAEASLAQSQASLARPEEANARAQERDAKLFEEMTKLCADRAESEERYKTETGRRREADAQASHEEARRREAEQRLADAMTARAHLEDTVRTAEELKRRFEAAQADWQQALAEERAQRKVVERKLAEQALKREAADSELRETRARAEEAERKLEAARKQLAHQLQATQAADTAAAVREADLRIQLAMATSALATWQTKAQRAHAQLTEADATWRAEKERLQAAASSSNATWQADVHRLEAALAAAESHQEELSERSAGLEARLADLKASAAAAAKEGAAEDAAAAREEAAAAWKDAAAAQQEAEAAARREAELKGAYEKVQAEVAQQSRALTQVRASSARIIADLKKDVATHRSKIVELEKKITDASTSETALLEEALAKQRSRHQQEMQDAAAKERSTSTALEASKRVVSTLRNEKAALDEEVVVLRQKVQDNTSARERKAEMQVDILKDEIKELKQKAHEAYMHIKALSADRTRTFGRSALPASSSVSASPRSILDLDGDAKTFSSTGCAK